MADTVSQTALGMAMSRALHRRLASQPVIDDPIAETFPGVAEYVEWALHRGESAATGTAPVMPLARARYFDEVALDAVGRGVRQILVLGAGLDTFAYRHAEALASAVVYEVDKPETQTWKREALSGVDLAHPPNIRYVAADLGHGSLLDELDCAGFDRRSPAVVSWLGVTYYLDYASVARTVEQLGQVCSSSSLVMDYFRPRDCWDDGMINGADVARQRGEPWVTTLTDTDVDKLLTPNGFSVVELFTSEHALQRYPSDVRLASNVATAAVHARRT